MRYVITVYRNNLKEAGFKWNVDDPDNDPFHNKLCQRWAAYKNMQVDSYPDDDGTLNSYVGEVLPEELYNLREFIDSVGGDMEQDDE